jgi:site-specific DNA-methyltransferase (adenine-specific)
MFKVDYNPDVLSCLANLSNDEVFTPPALANEILDMLPKKLWSNKETTFLDPVSKSGVFLREIAKRLIIGLEDEIPDMQTRVNHILKNQLFGIAITELTSLLSRRSLYCSKTANGKYSICNEFDTESGNILFDKIQHTWKNGKCEYCKASKGEYDRDDKFESHAYHFIHTDKPEEIFNMKFDVIIGNPPYQLNDGGGMGTSAVPIYHRFIEKAKLMNPRFLSMIIPARWYSGGKGLDAFRSDMLNDSRMSKLIDYFDSTECFPGVDISGGICYFLWERDYNGNCEILTIRGDSKNKMTRPLLEKNIDSFIRFNESASIIRKVMKNKENKLSSQISVRRPFRITTSKVLKNKTNKATVKLYAYPENGWVERKSIMKNTKAVDMHKVFIAKAYGERGSFPYLVLGKPFLGEPNSCCTETYLLFGPYYSKIESQNVISYIKTKFFRFLVLQKKNTQNAAKGVYSLVPEQNFDEEWTDEKLYKKYDLNQEEIDFIESMIRPMEIDND